MEPIIFNKKTTSDDFWAFTNYHIDRRIETLQDLYSGSDDTWLLHSSSYLELVSTVIDFTSNYDSEYTELIGSVKNFCESYIGKQHPSSLIRFVTAIAAKYLNLLSKLELTLTIIEKAIKEIKYKSSVDDDLKKSDKNGSTKPLRGHVLHTACLLHAGMKVLNIYCKDNKQVHEKLFDWIIESLEMKFKDGRLAKDYIEILEGLSADQRKQFISDCWMLTALIHDIGFLPMLEILFYYTRKGDELEPRSYANLSQFIDVMRRKVLDNLDTLGLSINERDESFFPDVENSGIDVEENPARSHGILSGYTILNYLANENIWPNLTSIEKLAALIVCSSSIFHCVKNKPINNEIIWKTHPMGSFLKLIDIMQEWVRVSWITEEYQKSKNLIIDNPRLNPLNGLNIVIGQCAIPETEIFLEGDILTINYIKAGYLYIVGEKKDGKYDFAALMDSQKTQELPQAMELLTKFKKVKVILSVAKRLI